MWPEFSKHLNHQPQNQYRLQLEKTIVELVDTTEKKLKPLSVDFNAGALGHRVQYGGGVSQPIAKACGLNKRRDLTIVDATCGLARDAFVLASIGAKVIAFERNPVICWLAKDALLRYSNDAITLDIQLKDSLEALKAMPDDSIDVVLLDPMFPKRDKSALVKKEMQMFHGLIGTAPSDADDLLAAAMRVASKRVVVKRPKAAGFLAEMEPTLSQKGKSGRFDIYTKAAIK